MKISNIIINPYLCLPYLWLFGILWENEVLSIGFGFFVIEILKDE